jgi:phage minor structural protein
MVDILTVYNADETIAAYLSAAGGDACKIISCRQQLTALEGGVYEDKLALTVQADHPDAIFVTKGALIGFFDEDGYFQRYRIVEPTREDAQTHTITALCEHELYELLSEPIEDVRPTNTTAGEAVASILDGTRWELGVAHDLGANSVRVYYTSVLSGLAQIAARWGGELRFRMTVTGGVVDHRYVDILARRGAVTGKSFVYAKDLLGIKYTENIKGLSTALYGRGKGIEIPTDDPNSKAYGRRLNFADVVWSTDKGDPVDKPLGQEWVGDDAAKAAWGLAGGTRHSFGFVTFDDETDPATLLRRTWDYLQIIKNPLATYEMSVILLEGLTGYEHEAVRLGDTVGVINTSTNPPIVGTARVIALDRNLLDRADAQVTLGNYIPTIDDSTIAQQLALQSFRDKEGAYDRAGQAIVPAPAGSALQNAIDLLTTQLFSTVSHHYTDANGNYVWESADGTKALKLGGGILALANSKLPNGEFDWATYATGDGITATSVLAATGTFLSLITGDPDGSRLEMGKGTNNEPYARMKNADGETTSQWDKDGMLFGLSAVRQWTTPGGHRHGIGMFPRATE